MEFRRIRELNFSACVLVTALSSGVCFPPVEAYASTNSSGQLPGFGSPWPYLLNLFLALAVVVALAILLIRFLAKRANVRQKGTISVLAARQLGQNKSIQVVEVGSKRYLLGVGNEVTLLADVSDTFLEETVTSSEEGGTAEPFRQVLLDKLASLRDTYRPNGTEEGEK